MLSPAPPRSPQIRSLFVLPFARSPVPHLEDMAAVTAGVGRPNTWANPPFFNRIAGKRIAIVHDEPASRDRITAEVEWRGQPFTLVDTGGIGLMRGEKPRT